MKNVIRSLLGVAMLAAASLVTTAQASVVVAGTRVIFNANEREVTVKLSNEGESSALVQTWLDTGDMNASPDSLEVPFTLTPAMFRMDPKKGQTLRLIYTGQPLPKDKESLFWLNVLEVPPKSQLGDDVNRIQMAYRTRIKVMFRPTALPGRAEEAPAAVKWELTRNPQGGGYALVGSNASPFHVNLGSVAVLSGTTTFDAGAGYIAPGATETFPVAGFDGARGAGLSVQYLGINDWGAGVQGQSPLGNSATP